MKTVTSQCVLELIDVLPLSPSNTVKQVFADVSRCSISGFALEFNWLKNLQSDWYHILFHGESWRAQPLACTWTNQLQNVESIFELAARPTS